eukprot:9153565-Heterocapsa_arctica.AAC.1
MHNIYYLEQTTTNVHRTVLERCSSRGAGRGCKDKLSGSQDYQDCPVNSFNTSSVDFAKLPKAKYRMTDFIELVHHFPQLQARRAPVLCVSVARCCTALLCAVCYWRVVLDNKHASACD